VRRAPILLLLLLLAGCATVGNPEVARDEQIAKIKAGESTRADVKAILGQPSSMAQMPRIERGADGAPVQVGDEEIWHYYRFSMRARPETFIPIIGPLVGGFDSESRVLTIRFDENGIVRWIGHGRTQGTTGPPAAKD
jgi:outer membrane protein assembly factor BamE (lipoprotein component of BamABCDE complex)